MVPPHPHLSPLICKSILDVMNIFLIFHRWFLPTPTCPHSSHSPLTLLWFWVPVIVTHPPLSILTHHHNNNDNHYDPDHHNNAHHRHKPTIVISNNDDHHNIITIIRSQWISYCNTRVLTYFHPFFFKYTVCMCFEFDIALRIQVFHYCWLNLNFVRKTCATFAFLQITSSCFI